MAIPFLTLFHEGNSAGADERPVVFLDIDNTLYSASSKISQAMGERIHGGYISIICGPFLIVIAAYFVSLGLEEERASELHHKYYTEYGLALRGLVRHHEIGEVAQFNALCRDPCSSNFLRPVGFRPEV